MVAAMWVVFNGFIILTTRSSAITGIARHAMSVKMFSTAAQTYQQSLLIRLALAVGA